MFISYCEVGNVIKLWICLNAVVMMTIFRKFLKGRCDEDVDGSDGSFEEDYLSEKVVPKVKI